MLIRKSFGLMAVCLISLSVAVRAESLADKEKNAAQDKEFKENLQSTNESCGSAITGKINYASFKGSDPDGSYSVSGYCGAALDGVRRICDTADGKAAVKEKIKRVHCSYSGKDKRAAALSNGTLSFKVDWAAANSDDFVVDYLKNNL